MYRCKLVEEPAVFYYYDNFKANAHCPIVRLSICISTFCSVLVVELRMNTNLKKVFENTVTYENYKTHLRTYPPLHLPSTRFLVPYMKQFTILQSLHSMTMITTTINVKAQVCFRGVGLVMVDLINEALLYDTLVPRHLTRRRSQPLQAPS